MEEYIQNPGRAQKIVESEYGEHIPNDIKERANEAGWISLIRAAASDDEKMDSLVELLMEHNQAGELLREHGYGYGDKQASLMDSVKLVLRENRDLIKEQISIMREQVLYLKRLKDK